MKKLLYIMPVLLLLIGGISYLTIGQKQEVSSRSIPQVCAKNTSITPSENYVLKTHDNFYSVQRLPDDMIVYIKDDIYGLKTIQTYVDENFFVVSESNQDRGFQLRIMNFVGGVIAASNNISVVYNEHHNCWWISSVNPNQELGVYSVSYSGGDVIIEKIESQIHMEKIYANVLSSKSNPYHAYIPIAYDGVPDSPYENPVFIPGELTTRGTEIYYNVGDNLNIRIVNAEHIDNYPSQDYYSDINVQFLAQYGSFGIAKLHFKNDSKYTLSFNGTRLLPGYEVDCTVNYVEDEINGNRYDISLDNMSSTFENLNVENNDTIYVNGITPDYVNKMRAIQNFAFRIDWEENVNKTFKITLSENAMYEVPIRMSDGGIYKLVPGKSYSVSITWTSGASNISITELAK